MIILLIDIYKSFLLLGTLNPALQDRNGQPKRDITTIIHILNDLLCAQYKNYTPGTPSDSPTSAATATTTSAASSTATANSSSRTRSSEPHKSEDIIKPTNPESAPCSCSNDPSTKANSTLLQKTATKPITEDQSIFTSNGIERNNKFHSQIHTIG